MKLWQRSEGFATSNTLLSTEVECLCGRWGVCGIASEPVVKGDAIVAEVVLTQAL